MAYLDLSWKAFRPPEGFYTSEVQTPKRFPVRTFLPTGYEPNYPYPLLVFLHNEGGSDEQIMKLAPRLSRRNFISIGLRGPHALEPRRDGRLGYGWGDPAEFDAFIEDYVFRAVEQTRRHYHVHSERIYLAGFREGATLAYCLGLTFPERFAGVISFNGLMPRQGGPLLRLQDVRSLKVFIGHGVANSSMPLSLAQADYRLFYSAGMDVRIHAYPTTNRLHPAMLRDVNRWIIDQCAE